MVSFNLVLISFQKKLILSTLNMVKNVFDFWLWIPSQKSKTYEPS